MSGGLTQFQRECLVDLFRSKFIICKNTLEEHAKAFSAYQDLVHMGLVSSRIKMRTTTGQYHEFVLTKDGEDWIKNACNTGRVAV